METRLDLSRYKVLHLSVKKLPFDVMVTGEKPFEFRKKSKSGWIESRLFDKNDNPRFYDYIKITNGYGKDVPYFISKLNSVLYHLHSYHIDNYRIYGDIHYSNNLVVESHLYDYVIPLGEIVETGNLKGGSNENNKK